MKEHNWKRLLGWIGAHTLYFMGDMAWRIFGAAKSSNWLMVASGKVQRWAGNKGPWFTHAVVSEEELGV